MTPSRPSEAARRVPPLLALALAVAGPLAGCSSPVDRAIPTAAVPGDYHLRHPVVLANEPTHLDVFPLGAAGVLDTRTMRQIQAFAADYRREGQGTVLIRVPDAPADPAATARTVAALRSALVGLGAGPVDVARYPVADPRLASPLHVSFVKMQARIQSRCGDWPDDLASGSTTNGWNNRSYYNLGCASTKTLAAQIDDPRDLVSPRAEDPTDVQLRTRAIGLLRGDPTVHPGKDPGTNWSGAALAPLVTLGGN